MTTDKKTYTDRIADDERLISALEDAISVQKRHVQELETTLKNAKSILNRMLKGRRDLRKDLKTAKTGKSQYPSRIRKYTKEHLGDVLNGMFKGDVS